MASPDWVIEQLAGKRRKLTLAGHSAPHGRPRQGAVVTEEMKPRQTKVYTDPDAPPVRHIFGRAFQPFELKGRFRDPRGGKGYAVARKLELKQFVDEMQQVRITWGGLVSVDAFIENLKIGWESPEEIEWTLSIDVDADNTLGTRLPVPAPRSASELTGLIMALLKAPFGDILKTPPTMRGSLFDSLGSLISSINSISSSVVGVADQIDSLANAPLDLLRRFSSGLGQFRTALLKLRNTYDNVTARAALEGENVREQQALWSSQAAFGKTVVEVLRQVAEAERQSTIAQQGLVKGVVTAQGGDTWESLSGRAYDGDPGRADDLRQANGVEAGSPPNPGTAYLVPR